MLNEVIEKYFAVYPEDRARLGLLQEQLSKGEKLDGRHNYTGHVTGSALIFSPDLTKVLMIYHPTFNRWQQPGGHWDEDEAGPWLTAEREIKEEVGLDIKITPLVDKDDLRVPVDIDSHLVPKTPPKNEPDHYHHDFKYAVISGGQELRFDDDVIKEAQWMPIERVAHKDIRRAVDRSLSLLKLKA